MGYMGGYEDFYHQYDAAASAVGNHRNRFAAVATQGKEKCIQFFIIGIDVLNDILFAFLCIYQIHNSHLI